MAAERFRSCLPAEHFTAACNYVFCTWQLQTHTNKAILITHSGSGKSTLLDILAQRKTVGKIKGEVLIAGQRPTQTFLRRYSGYVEQFDTLIPVLTVYEMLLYTAELKTPRTVPLKVFCHTTCHLLPPTSDILCLASDGFTGQVLALTSSIALPSASMSQ